MKMILLMAAAAAGGLMASGGVAAHASARQCQEAKAKVEANVTGYYNPRIAQLDEVAKSGTKLDDVKVKVPQANGDEQWITFAELKGRLVSERALASIEVNKAIDDCEKGFKPYQAVMDDFMTIATGGLSKLLPGRMTRVDVSDILAGYPLGGPNALIPKFREQILGGNRGTVANIIRDPIKCITFQRKC